MNRVEREDRVYIAIDLKSYYASVECRLRGLDPMTTNLVVADDSRTDKTICLAVSPSLKAHGIPGRPRLFQVKQAVKQINDGRLGRLQGKGFSGSSWHADELEKDPYLKLDYITATPRMAYYIKVSTQIYQIYLRYVAPEDIHVYSIDEVFMDVTDYLETYQTTAEDLCREMILDVMKETGITATAGIGTNLFLCKIAMDIVAKHIPADEHGVRIAMLDEMSYRRLLWNHRPLTDFWRVGTGYARKLEANGMFTMGDIARCSVHNEDLLYHLFGVNAELLIDHAWGYESARISDIRAYKPESKSLGSGQVLANPYSFDKARLIVREMTDQLALDLVSKGLVTDQLVLTVNYDRTSLDDAEKAAAYKGKITRDWYGRSAPEHAHGSVKLERKTSSSKLIVDAMMKLYDRITDPLLLVRRIDVTAGNVVESAVDTAEKEEYTQLSLFDLPQGKEVMPEKDMAPKLFEHQDSLEREKRMQEAVLKLRDKFGKNAVLKGMNLEEGATMKERNKQIGGHKA